MLSMALENTGYDLMYVSDKQSFARQIAVTDDRPELVIYMTDSRLVKPEDFLSLFLEMSLGTPCIIITNQNCSIIEEKLLNSGIVKQHLIKPVSLKELRNAIQLSKS